MKRPVRIGVVGAGRWAVRHHIPALLANPDAVLVAVADTDPTRLDRVTELFDLRHRYDCADALFDAQPLDGVVIAVPHVAHFAAARAALKRGVHVLVEKPMTLQGAHAWDLVARARAARLHLVVGYPYHFSRHVARARTIVASGRLGPLNLINVLYCSARSHLYRPGPRGPDDPNPRTYADPAVAGGGQGQTEVTHALALLLHVTGLRATRVSAHMRDLDYPVDVIDTMMVEFEGGCVGTLASIGVIPSGQPEHRQFRYFGSAGMVTHDLATGALTGTSAGQSIRTRATSADDIYPAHLPTAGLVRLLTGGRTNPAPGRLGAEVVSCLEAAYRSARAGGQPAELRRGPDPPTDRTPR
ncbi:MAG: Gfo/Idh/MocA family protein [Micromonosporaceae bacterium]